MMKPVYRIKGESASSTEGEVCYDWPKLSWNLGMILGAVVFAPFTFSIEVFLLFLFMTYFSLLIGHSVGMHRMMIHRSFDAHPIIEKMLIYIGVLVGMSGPFGIIRIHDARDWAQRQGECHDFFSHKTKYLKDLWWQLTCQFTFRYPPQVIIESKFAEDPFYQHLEKYWQLHQLLLATPLYLMGGWPYVVWGIFVRVAVSISGHWTVTYFCHNSGHGSWRVRDAAVQASNIPGLGIVTYGECWHNNHHAFPESARIGLEKGQCDPGWRFIQMLAFMGLARNIGLPRSESERDDLIKNI